MTKTKSLGFLIGILLICQFGLYAQNGLWTNISSNDVQNDELEFKNETPKEFDLYHLRLSAFKNLVSEAPERFSGDSNIIIELPTENGKLASFRVYQAPVLESGLQAKYPHIRSYAAQDIDNPSAVARFSVSPNGVNVMITSGNHSTIYIDPYTKDKKNYIVYNVKQLPQDGRGFICSIDESMQINDIENQTNRPEQTALNANDGQLRTFRLALACTHQYAQFHLDNQNIDLMATEQVKKTAILSEMNTAVTRIDGIYERDLSATFVIVNNDDDLIFYNAGNDPYTNSDLGVMLGQNQTTCDNIIGANNYDFGHVFGTEGGGLAYQGVICNPNYKAQGGTGINSPISDYFYVSYVSHEMGHQFGSSHTFSGTNGGCYGNRMEAAAMEPGSGSTIMSYAGLCTGEDIQYESDDYFHAKNIEEMSNYISNYAYYCATASNENNTAPEVDAGGNYNIPALTPFVLVGSATDVDNDELTYSWEEMDDVNQSLNMVQPPVSSNMTGPLFRSFPPSDNDTRYFPALSTVLSGNTQNTWEVTSSVGRTLNFRLTVRDNVAGGGQSNSDDMQVAVDGDAGPFIITSQNSSTTWQTQTTETVTWNVANTDAASINCAEVDILFSTDGGYTYPITIAENVPNNGSKTIQVPNVNTSQGRIMVKGSDNIFFDVNDTNIKVTGELGVDEFTQDDFSVYPNPSAGKFTVEFQPSNAQTVQFTVYNLQGKVLKQMIYDNEGNGKSINYIDLTNFESGVYLLEIKNGSFKTVKRLVKQ